MLQLCEGLRLVDPIHQSRFTRRFTQLIGAIVIGIGIGKSGCMFFSGKNVGKTSEKTMAKHRPDLLDSSKDSVTFIAKKTLKTRIRKKD